MLTADTCRNGHPSTEENTRPDGRCRTCVRDAQTRRRTKERDLEDQRRLAAVTAGIADGLTRPEIADQLGITRSALTQWAKRRGVELPVAHWWTQPVEPIPADPAETRIIGDRGWVRCGVHGDVPRTGSLRLTVPHSRGRLTRIAELHAHCHVVPARARPPSRSRRLPSHPSPRPPRTCRRAGSPPPSPSQAPTRRRPAQHSTRRFLCIQTLPPSSGPRSARSPATASSTSPT